MANRRFIDFPIAASVGDNDIVLIWQDGLNKQTTKATLFAGSPNSLAGLTDVDISALTNGQILQYNSTTSKWENVDRTDIDLDELGDVTIVSPTNGQVLVYNSSTSKWENSSGGFVPYTGAVTTVNLGAQSILAGSFVKAGGTSAQFLKADGSVDSTAYGTGSVTSVALTMPSAFSVANSPVTTAGTLAVTGAGTVAQYVRGDGSLADFPSTTGGGSSVSYYLNGSVNQGTFGGVTYYEVNRTPVLGAGTDFTINADGYIASFITDAMDPNQLVIPSGNWNFETYFQASSGGGSPTFYVELYKVSGTTFTLIASSSGSPELIAFGTNLTPYFSTLAVPQTTLALTDRLAIRYYVAHSGRTITLHTENNTLCQIITTFTTGLTALNGLTNQVQFFAVGTSGTDFNIASATDTHTFNLPTASSSNRGALSTADWSTFNAKQNALTNPVTGTGSTGQVAYWSSGSEITGESNLFWDASNNRLGINNASPAVTLDLSGTSLFTHTSGYGINNKYSSENLQLFFGTVIGGKIGIQAKTISASSVYTLYLNPEGGGIEVSGASTFLNSITASSFVKSGGTSSEFLKADGSVDSTIYVPNGRTITINGTSQDLSANRTFNVGTVTSVTATAGTGISISGSPITSSGTLNITNTAPDQVVSLTASTGISISGTYPNFTITNTSPSSGGTVTSVTASTPLFSSGGATPNITIQQASGSQNGFLSSTDWTTFNNKQNALTNPVTGTGSAGQVAYWSSGSAITGESNLFWDSTNDFLGIGQTPFYNLDVNGYARFTYAVSPFRIRDTNYPQMSFLQDKLLTNGNAIAVINFQGRFNSTTFGTGASINTEAVGNWSSTNYGTDLIFSTVTQNTDVNSERMRITSDGYQRMASGTKGIQFNGDTAAANALDDYEEGTHSPNATPAGGGSFTTVTQSGSYVKVGQMVNYSFIITINSVGTGTGDVSITLPFVCGLNPIRPMGSGRENALYGNTLQIRTVSDGSATALIIGGGVLLNGWQALGTITYRTTA
jgi:hypothetical protein